LELLQKVKAAATAVAIATAAGKQQLQITTAIESIANCTKYLQIFPCVQVF